MSTKRSVDLDHGVAMVVTDLHGEGDVYDCIRAKFMELYEKGLVQYLILCGDLIHGYGEASEDDSLRMLVDVIQLQRRFGSHTIIMLLGNHEMPHIYGVTLSKGDQAFTPRFEHALSHSGRRDEVLAFLRSLPFVVRTKAGVLITHSGPTMAINSAYKAERILTFDHLAVLKLADDQIAARYPIDNLRKHPEYTLHARYHLAIEGPDDPRYSEFLRGQLISQTSEEFNLLWEVLFARGEVGLSEEFQDFFASEFLKHMSVTSPYEQRIVLYGHLPVRGGHKVIGQRQFRLASYSHANPPEDGEYLLVDCAQPIISARQLLGSLRQVFD